MKPMEFLGVLPLGFAGVFFLEFSKFSTRWAPTSYKWTYNSYK